VTIILSLELFVSRTLGSQTKMKLTIHSILLVEDNLPLARAYEGYLAQHPNEWTRGFSSSSVT